MVSIWGRDLALLSKSPRPDECKHADSYINSSHVTFEVWNINKLWDMSRFDRLCFSQPAGSERIEKICSQSSVMHTFTFTHFKQWQYVFWLFPLWFHWLNAIFFEHSKLLIGTKVNQWQKVFLFFKNRYHNFRNWQAYLTGEDKERCCRLIHRTHDVSAQEVLRLPAQ